MDFCKARAFCTIAEDDGDCPLNSRVTECGTEEFILDVLDKFRESLVEEIEKYMSDNCVDPTTLWGRGLLRVIRAHGLPRED